MPDTVIRRRAAILVVALGLLGSALVHGSAAEAAPSVRIKAIGAKEVSPGKKATVRPVVAKRRTAKVRSVRLSVRRGSTWIVRNKKSARLAAGTYRVRTTVKYRLRNNGGVGRLRTISRTQTLRVRTVKTPVVRRPDTAPSSVGVTGAPCDSGTLRKDDGSAWACTFSDEFVGTTLDTRKWVVQQTATSGYRNGDECYVDRPGNVSVANGALHLTVRKESASFLCKDLLGDRTTSVTSGMVSTWGLFDQAYGRFEIRAAFPASKKPGLHGALWLWPTDATAYGAWPLSGEIDIGEMYSQYPDRVIPYIHYLLGTLDSTVTNNHCLIDDVSAFHTYTLEWTTTTLTIAYDGKVCVSHRINSALPLLGSAPFDRPFLIALTQGLGSATNAMTSATELPATTKIDYVRVWK